MPPFIDQRLVLITLLVKLGVAAAVAGAVVRSRFFKGLLFKEERTLREQIYLVMFMAAPFGLGVLVRLNVRNFLAADLGFESSILMGVMIGRAGGVLGATLVSFTAGRARCSGIRRLTGKCRSHWWFWPSTWLAFCWGSACPGNCSIWIGRVGRCAWPFSPAPWPPLRCPSKCGTARAS